VSYFNRDEWLRLDNFCRTHPAIRRVLQYIYANPDRDHTVQSVARESDMAVSFFDLKALFVHKLLTAVDAQGQPIGIAWDLTETARYRLVKDKIRLVQAVLERRELAWDAQGGVIWEEDPSDVFMVPPSGPEG